MALRLTAPTLALSETVVDSAFYCEMACSTVLPEWQKYSLPLCSVKPRQSVCLCAHMHFPLKQPFYSCAHSCPTLYVPCMYVIVICYSCIVPQVRVGLHLFRSRGLSIIVSLYCMLQFVYNVYMHACDRTSYINIILYT